MAHIINITQIKFLNIFLNKKLFLKDVLNFIKEPVFFKFYKIDIIRIYLSFEKLISL